MGKTEDRWIDRKKDSSGAARAELSTVEPDREPESPLDSQKREPARAYGPQPFTLKSCSLPSPSFSRWSSNDGFPFARCFSKPLEASSGIARGHTKTSQ